MEIIEDIKKAYYIVNEKLVSEKSFNDRITRCEVIDSLVDMLQNSKVKQVRIICDEANNTPEVIDNNQMVARVEWRKNKFDTEVKYIDLVFGVGVEIIWND